MSESFRKLFVQFFPSNGNFVRKIEFWRIWRVVFNPVSTFIPLFSGNGISKELWIETRIPAVGVKEFKIVIQFLRTIEVLTKNQNFGTILVQFWYKWYFAAKYHVLLKKNCQKISLFSIYRFLMIKVRF